MVEQGDARGSCVSRWDGIARESRASQSAKFLRATVELSLDHDFPAGAPAQFWSRGFESVELSLQSARVAVVLGGRPLFFRSGV